VSASVPNLPTQSCGTEITRFNALKHGVLSRSVFALGPFPIEGARDNRHVDGP
jgi:hypothetical protein